MSGVAPPENIRAVWPDGTVIRPKDVRRLRPVEETDPPHWEAVFSMEEFPRGLFPAGAALRADGPLGGVELTAIIESEDMPDTGCPGCTALRGEIARLQTELTWARSRRP
jgi:hypothetical protein